MANASTTQPCPDCAQPIGIEAHVCPYCAYRLSKGPALPDGVVDPGRFSARIAAGVSTTALMTAVDVFLIGALLVAHNASTRQYGAPILLLGVSGLGFLYGTLIYANSYAKIEKESDFTRQMDCGNLISEALGVCPLVLSVPLVVAAGPTSAALAWSAFGASAIAFGAYQRSTYSLLGRPKHLDTTWAVILSITLFLIDAYGVWKLRMNGSTEVRFLGPAVMVVILIYVTIYGIWRVRPVTPRHHGSAITGREERSDT